MRALLPTSLPTSSLIFSLLALAGAAHAATVEIHVTGVAAGKGKVNVAVCDKERFLKQCAYSGSMPARDGDNVIRVAGVPAGTWAVLAYQDENENGELDRNFVGIPKENYGFSREARGKFGPPDFGDAAIEVGSETTVAAVRLR
ncbi:DUF2141 domain-containing protein [Massilia sp. YIM B02763]|uniref:DUF2141 domain-containing protein n=1 Tax=Massilia sp. YIM B02763 TaxID=3050130 RepID=UPI0025B6A694|nr:DUF2141 domain-containing protein [Massilia sp. YIM B02763]MDN4055543.1 DUF2141 domain-containing protein [Massilia sp. YIM B02763]